MGRKDGWRMSGNVTVNAQSSDDPHQPFDPPQHLLSVGKLESRRVQKHGPLRGVTLDLMPDSMRHLSDALRSTSSEEKPEDQEQIGLERIPGPNGKAGLQSVPPNLYRKANRQSPRQGSRFDRDNGGSAGLGHVGHA
jgi:hypothetical protein